MSDFSELCPVFNTGVFNEMLFPAIGMTDVSACANALYASADSMGEGLGTFVFSRTVVITAAWLRRTATNKGKEIYHLRHHTSAEAAGTIFGSLTVSVTVVGFEPHSWVPMTITEMTFTSAAVLGLAPATVTAASGGVIDVMIRYKEK